MAWAGRPGEAGIGLALVSETGSEAPQAYYVPGPDGAFAPTRATESPWSSDAQHGGPPTALLAHVMRTRHPAGGMRIARITVEFLGAIPRVPLTADSQVVKDGRRVRLLEGRLLASGKPMALARAWQISANGEGGVAVDRLPAQAPPPIPEAQPQHGQGGLPNFEHWGYGESIEWRWVHGPFESPVGEAAVWARPRVPLVLGQPGHPQDLALIVADSANGISGPFDPRELLFIPPAVTVTLHRHPAGEWICLAAATMLAPDGLGSTLGTLSDAAGVVGSVAQPLLVSRH
jgi:hypothetical protein